MPFKHGKTTELWLDAVDVSPYFNDAEFGVEVDTGETTSFKATYKTFIEGDAGSKLAAKGYFDPVVDAQLALTLRNGGSVLTFMPAGAVAIGDLARLMAIDTTKLAESSPVGGVVLMSYEAQATGIVGFGQVLHILTVDSGTTTGATKDDGAASATGWQAHLHVTAISSGSWTVKLQDASAANFSDGADVTGGSFTALTVPGQQRLVGATNLTALRRYVRYVATVVGGSTPTITFGLAYARSGGR